MCVCVKGLAELLDEGAVQMLRDRGDDGNGTPILAAVGQLQFEVVEYRLKAEYGVESRLEVRSYICFLSLRFHFNVSIGP